MTEFCSLPQFRGKRCGPSCQAWNAGEKAWEYSARNGATGDVPEAAATDARRESAQKGNCEIVQAERKFRLPTRPLTS
ncbi:MAG TPA: hypothetical protein VEW42_06745 [Candidatus Eisenbacteria bacterium]|nr:hypothetical protein [Candidatus Eisenbacteria bacterium]